MGFVLQTELHASAEEKRVLGLLTFFFPIDACVKGTPLACSFQTAEIHRNNMPPWKVVGEGAMINV
jgi:hypothetical protein